MTENNAYLIAHVQAYLKESYNLLVGDLSAECLIVKATRLEHSDTDPFPTITLGGRSLVTGYPIGIELLFQELFDVLTKAGWSQPDPPNK
jgi:hypothetical protein